MLLPAAQRRGEIHFYVAKGLPYTARLVLAFLLMAAGLAIQFLFLAPELGPRLDDILSASGEYHRVFLMTRAWWGLPLVLAGVVLLLTKGYQNVGAQKIGSQEWRPARRAEIARILAINAKQKKWDHELIDITNARGVLGLIGFVILVVAALSALNAAGLVRSAALAAVLSFNAAIMLLPFWVTGARFILKNDRLVVKATQFLKLEDAFNQLGKSDGEEFQYQMQTAKAKDDSGDVPHDIKALIAFHEGPPEFLGMQMQISINSVQGTDYPYFYCVLVAKPEFGGLDESRLDAAPRKVIVEAQHQDDVDVTVIRQETTKNSGYHTNPKAAAVLFNYALTQARRLVAQKPR